MVAPLAFAHLGLENWRNFAHVDVDLQKRVFLVGPNASGKSNFLDVFRFLHDIVAVGGGFEEAVRKRGGVSLLRCYAARSNPDVGVSVTITGEDNPSSTWDYEIRFFQDNARRPKISAETVLKNGVNLLHRPNTEDARDPERLRQTFLEQVNVNKEFRELADFLRTVRYLHIVPQLVREPERSVGRQSDPFGGDFLDQIASTPLPTQKARLRRIRDALRIAVPQLQDLELKRDERGTPHLRGKYKHWRAKGAWQTEDQFSDGTLRLMGLLWAVMGGPGPLLLEEPELSLHPEVIQYIPQMLNRVQRRIGNQIFISTHSSELLKDTGIGLDEVLLLEPTKEGTIVSPAGRFNQIVALLQGGATLADAVLPRTRPIDAHQLALFDF
jgi:predicted ATPase